MRKSEERGKKNGMEEEVFKEEKRKRGMDLKNGKSRKGGRGREWWT